MNVTLDFVNCPQEELKALLDGGTLTIYSVARPLTADKPVERSGTLATFTFASPAFGAASDGLENPVFSFILARCAGESDRFQIHRRGRLAGAARILRHPSSHRLSNAHDMTRNRRTHVSLATVSVS